MLELGADQKCPANTKYVVERSVRFEEEKM